MVECRAGAATDVTGFGLIGHACEMARGAGVTLRIDLSAVPLMNGLSELIADGMLPAGCYRNRDHYLPLIDGKHRDSDALLPLFDPQTSGGLLIALAPKNADQFMRSAEGLGIFARRIGEVLPLQAYSIEVL